MFIFEKNLRKAFDENKIENKNAIDLLIDFVLKFGKIWFLVFFGQTKKKKEKYHNNHLERKGTINVYSCYMGLLNKAHCYCFGKLFAFGYLSVFSVRWMK